MRSEFKNALDMRDPAVMVGRVLGPPVRRGGRSLGYDLLVEGVEDKEGNSAGGEGVVYVISLFGDEDYGDVVKVRGVMKDGYFLASKTSIISRDQFGRMRRRLQTLLLKRFGGGGGGNISSLLLTGTTTDGSKDVQEWARRYGVSHLFALSGMHLAFLSGVAMVLLSPLVGKSKAKAVSFLICIFFVYING
ncbi:MAG: ComEC/Rec2 family competence protein, partial [Candidatus Ornithospirochaeta sp.]